LTLKGYVVGLYPLAYLAQRYPTAKMTGLYTFVWGIVMLLQVVVTDFQGAYAQRFFLGLCEAGVTPAYTLITSMFYKKQEQSLRFPLWYATGFCGLGCGSFITYGLVHIETGFAKWKIMYLFYGVLTVIWAVVAWFVLPDSPGSCRWFTEREKYIVSEPIPKL
jgi:MFS family permease